MKIKFKAIPKADITLILIERAGDCSLFYVDGIKVFKDEIMVVDLKLFDDAHDVMKVSAIESSGRFVDMPNNPSRG